MQGSCINVLKSEFNPTGPVRFGVDGLLYFNELILPHPHTDFFAVG